MNIWETLGIEPTTDVKLIRRRYAELVRLYHPEDQPEIYQEIVEAYQKALTYARSRNTRPDNSLRKGSDSQEATELEEEENGKPKSSLNFETLTEETKTENEDSEASSLDFSDYKQSTDKTSNSFNFETFKAEEDEQKSTLDFSDYDEEVQLNGDSEERATSPLNFETFGDEENRGQEGTTRSTLDFSSYNEAAYLIRNAIESIVGNPDYTIEEQEHLWKQFFSQYRYNMSTVQSVLEEMDVYIFNKPEQFSIIIPLLEDYVPDFKYWGYYYKLKHWKVKRATAYKNGEPLEAAKKETAKLYASYRLYQAILEDSQKVNQIGVWIRFFKQSFSPSTVLFLLNNSKQMITCIPVLAYILEKIKAEVGEEEQKAYDELLAYFEEIKADADEPFDIHRYNLLNPSEVEEKLYLLLYSPYEDEYKLLRDWQYLFESVKDHTLLLDLLEKVDVYPLTNAKVLALVLQFVERYSDEESNPYLKKLHFWKSIHSYPSVVEEYALDKKENFDYWYNEGYLYMDKLTKSNEDINDWEKWRSYFKGRPRILTILLQQIYKEYHRFTDGKLLRYVLAPFPTSKMAPQLMTEETDQKLEEMTAYAYELSHPKTKLSYLDWKKRQVFKNKFLQIFFSLFTIVSLILSVLEQPGYNS
ncbi:hypothetical protein [Streptococcus oralis]|uniref:J domain-containing protein n=1 Tax=Streptococcus oralis subsp. oralis TaxID=1891914 RepID=A0A0F2D5R5_STROR|nr:hypothetical protein TZ87_00699 [Streptococcus oralis subsp. oralis]